MSDNKYRFSETPEENVYAVFEVDTGLRCPGLVTVSTSDGARLLTYRRELPPDPGKRKPMLVKMIEARSVKEMSLKLDRYFNERRLL